jgi:hypothetical protein
MFIFTGLTNLAFIFPAIICKRQKIYLNEYAGYFTLITSFIYHTLESF